MSCRICARPLVDDELASRWPTICAICLGMAIERWERLHQWGLEATLLGLRWPYGQQRFGVQWTGPIITKAARP